MNNPLPDLYNTVLYCLQGLVLRCTIRFKTQIKLVVISITVGSTKLVFNDLKAKSLDAYMINRIDRRHEPCRAPQHHSNG